MNLPPVPANLERAAGWSWRVLVCAAALVAVLAVLWYVRIIVLPVMIALTITPALSLSSGSSGAGFDSGARPPRSLCSWGSPSLPG